MSHDAWAGRARQIAVEFLAPRAADADRASTPPVAQIRELAAAGLLGLTTPTSYGGLGATSAVVRECLAAVASGCGVTAFVYFQHLIACRHIAGGANADLKARTLPALASGDRFCSVAFSHLRRSGPPPLRVRPEGEDWIFDGTAPWMTGWGLAATVLMAGVLPDGRSAWVVAPLAESEALRASPPMPLCAMNASATVALTLDGFRVGPECQVKTMTPAELAADTAGAHLFFTALSLGATRGALDLLHAGHPAAAGRLERALAQTRAAVERWAADPTPDTGPDGIVALRARCIDLSLRAAHAAVTIAGGAANAIDHPAQRLLREAMVYSLIAQTPDLRAAVLDCDLPIGATDRT